MKKIVSLFFVFTLISLTQIVNAEEYEIEEQESLQVENFEEEKEQGKEEEKEQSKEEEKEQSKEEEKEQSKEEEKEQSKEEELEQSTVEENKEDASKLTIMGASVQVENKENWTVSQWIDHAESQSSSINKLRAYIEGSGYYSNDERLLSGINNNARSVLKWTFNSHIDGQFDIVMDYYETILSSPFLDELVKAEAETSLLLASIKKRPFASNIFEYANNKATSVERLRIHIVGNNLYSSDSRFIDGINNNSKSVLNWTSNRHLEGQFDTAIRYYETILASSKLNGVIKSETKTKLQLAKNRNRPFATNIYELAIIQPTSFEKIEKHIIGNQMFSNDARFIEGIKNNSGSALKSISVKHMEGDFQTAIEQYEMLTVADLNEIEAIETQIKLELAKNRSRPFATNIFNVVKGKSTSVNRLRGHIVGNNLFTSDSRFIDGINNNGKIVLNYATNQHVNDAFGNAISHYETILKANNLNEEMRDEIEIKRTLANNEKRPVATNLYELAKSLSTSAERLRFFVAGYNLYPQDSRLQDGVNANARTVLNWAITQHKIANYESAMIRYNSIINTTSISASIRDEASKKLAEAKKDARKLIIEYINYNITMNEAAAIQKTLNPPPQTDKYRNSPAYIDSSMVGMRGIVTGESVNVRADSTTKSNVKAVVSKNNIVIIEKTVHGEMWGTSDQWYQIFHNGETLYIHSDFVNNTNITVAKQRSDIREQSNRNSHSFGSITRNTAVTIVNEIQSSNETWYQINHGVWRNAKDEDFLPFLNPNNNDMFQHLLLSSSVGVSASQLDVILTNTGVLHGRGQAFIDAALEHSINEIYLIAHAFLETGRGTSRLATGVEVGRNTNGNLELVTIENSNRLVDIKTTFNMYGINAVDGSALSQGAFYAYNHGWYTAEAAIIGGAKFIGEDYIHNNNMQNTLYKMRWNPARPGTKQYATDMAWATKQINTIKNLYGLLDDPVLHFQIPQYK
jgi:beta-N-acetylglucosaminidase